MIHTEHPAVNISILGGFKTLLIVGVGIFAFFQIDPLSEKSLSEVKVVADSYPFVVPKALQESYTGQNAQILLARSVWDFKIKNESSKDATNLVLDFPFSGSYLVQTADGIPQEGIPTFIRQIRIPSVGAHQETRVTLWVGEEINPELERKIQVQTARGFLSVEYPINPSGLISWVEKYKTPLSMGLFLLFLITVL